MSRRRGVTGRPGAGTANWWNPKGDAAARREERERERERERREERERKRLRRRGIRV